MMQVCHLFISPGHNFFGHHGQPAGEHPIVAVGQIECVAGRGIRGDRFFGYEPDYQGPDHVLRHGSDRGDGA